MAKSILTLIVTILILSGCQKATDDPVDLSVYKGKWAGLLKYNLDNKQLSINSTRTINNIVSVWWVVPECKSDFNPVNGIYPILAILTDSTVCKGIKSKWVFTWTGEGALDNDSLVESGILDYHTTWMASWF